MPNSPTTARTLVLAAVLLTPCCALGQEPPPDGPGEEIPVEPVGFDLGEYLIKDLRAAESATTRLSFTLHTSVPGNTAEKFGALLAARRQRVRDQVIISARLSEPEDFRDPELKHFRRRISVRLRRTLPELEIDDVFFSDFRYFVE